MEDNYNSFYTNDINFPAGKPIENLENRFPKKEENNERVQVKKFVDEARKNPLLKRNNISVESSTLMGFYKMMTVVAIVLIFAIVIFFGYLTFTDGFKSEFIDNSTLICEKTEIPAFPTIPTCPACNCNQNLSCPAFPTEIIIKDLEDILNKTA